MPTHSTLPPVEATTKAVDALLAAIEGNPSAGAAAAYRAALARHGRALHAEGGPEGLAAALARIRADTADRAQAETRERTALAAWETLMPAPGKAA